MTSSTPFSFLLQVAKGRTHSMPESFSSPPPFPAHQLSYLCCISAAPGPNDTQMMGMPQQRRRIRPEQPAGFVDHEMPDHYRDARSIWCCFSSLSRASTPYQLRLTEAWRVSQDFFFGVKCLSVWSGVLGELLSSPQMNRMPHFHRKLPTILMSCPQVAQYAVTLRQGLYWTC